jgi:hypothetical protein
MTLIHFARASALLLMVAGAAQAQTGTVGAGSYSIDSTTATVSQTITVTVPTRFGLHLHLNAWNLDLNTAGQPAGPSCFRAGNHSSGLGTLGTGRDTIYTGPSGSIPVTSTAAVKDAAILSLIAASTYRGDQVADGANPYSYIGSLAWNDTRMDTQPIGGYPGFYVNGGGVLEWKGPIMCSFQTIVQKFANTNGWRFTSSLTDNNVTPSSTNPAWTLPLYVADRFTSGAIAGFSSATGGLRLLPGATNARTLASAAPTTGTAAPRTTGGWLDDNILQVILFDGSETNGTYNGTVTYTLGDFTTGTIAFCPTFTGSNGTITWTNQVGALDAGPPPTCTYTSDDSSTTLTLPASFR